MGITGSYFGELQELTSIPVGAQLIGGVNDILFRANPALLGGSSVPVEDNLSSTSTTSALSAKQGKVLNDRLTTAEGTIGNYGNIVTYNASSFDAAGAAAAAQTAAQNYAEGLVTGLLDDRGNYNPNTNSSQYPTTGGSGASGAVVKGDLWAISADGNVNGIPVTVGDTIRALVDTPAQTNSNWAITQNNLIYVPENTTNKSTATDLGGASTSDTAYPSQKAVKTYVDANSMSSAQLRYSPKAVSGATYTVIPADITDSGKVILLVSHTAPATVTISAPLTLLGGVIDDHVGKSVNIRQAGTGTVTISGSTLVGTATTSTQHETKTLIVLSDNTWLIVGG